MTPFVINTARGCGQWKAPCVQCSIRELSPKEGTAEFFWKTVDYYNKNFGVNFFFEVCDSFLSFPKYVKKLVETMPFDPKERGIEFEVYTRANDVVNNKEAISLLKALNVTRVNVGIESGDDAMLGSINKGNRSRGLTPSQVNYEALRRLTKAGITFHQLVGAGDTRRDQRDAGQHPGVHAEDSNRLQDNLTTLEASSLIPMPNSPGMGLSARRGEPEVQVEGGVEASLAKYG